MEESVKMTRIGEDALQCMLVHAMSRNAHGLQKKYGTACMHHSLQGSMEDVQMLESSKAYTIVFFNLYAFQDRLGACDDSFYTPIPMVRTLPWLYSRSSSNSFLYMTLLPG